MQNSKCIFMFTIQVQAEQIEENEQRVLDLVKKLSEI